jgi:hypothetical protein
MRKTVAGLFVTLLLVVGGANLASAFGDNPGVKKSVYPQACQDGRDNDKDGLTDYPADPGCKSPEDTTETATT